METRVRAEGPGGTIAIGRGGSGDQSVHQSSPEWGAVSGTSAIATLVRPVEAPTEALQSKRPLVVEAPLLVVATAAETAYDELVATVIATTSPDVIPSDSIMEPDVEVPPDSPDPEVQDRWTSESLMAGALGIDPAPSVEMPHDPLDMATANFVEVADHDVMDCGQALPVSRGTSASSDVMSGLIAEVIARASSIRRPKSLCGRPLRHRHLANSAKTEVMPRLPSSCALTVPAPRQLSGTSWRGCPSEA
ncbi:MAG: hypothetical protein EBY11_14105 [Proteobacteria bacterium]|nr:hypothetical protein [Pseudomonadota bacterium]